METDWAQIKSVTLDNLIEVTSSMLEDYQQGRFSDSEKFLQERMQLVRDLEECERQLGEVLHPKSEDWLRQLQRLAYLDQQIDDTFEMAKALVRRLQGEQGDASATEVVRVKDLNSQLIDFSLLKKQRDS